jgi:hypothetical protein
LLGGYNYYAHTMSYQSLDRTELPADTNYLLDSLEEYEITELNFFQSASDWAHHPGRFSRNALQYNEKQLSAAAKNYLQAIVLSNTCTEPIEQVANMGSNFIFEAGSRRREHLQKLVPSIRFDYPLQQPGATAHRFMELLTSEQMTTEDQVKIMSVHYRLEFNPDTDHLHKSFDRRKFARPTFTSYGLMKKLFSAQM